MVSNQTVYLFIARYKAPELEIHARGVWLRAHKAGAVSTTVDGDGLAWLGPFRFWFGLGDMRSRFESAFEAALSLFLFPFTPHNKLSLIDLPSSSFIWIQGSLSGLWRCNSLSF